MSYSDIIDEAKRDRMDFAVEKADSLFSQRGIEAVKMTDIAKACDIGVASLYRYFGTKTEIIINVGILKWKNVCKLFNGIFDCDFYNNKSGIEQIHDLLKIQIVLFRSHKDFLKFLFEFDHYMLKENVDKKKLDAYEKSIMNIYPIFENAFKKGIKDGSVNSNIDFYLYYISISHSIINLCEKFIMGEVLPSDHFDKAESELELIIDMAINYLKTT